MIKPWVLMVGGFLVLTIASIVVYYIGPNAGEINSQVQETPHHEGGEGLLHVIPLLLVITPVFGVVGLLLQITGKRSRPKYDEKEPKPGADEDEDSGF